MIDTLKSVSVLLVVFCVASCKTQDRQIEWTPKNVDIDIPGSYCYDSLQANCDRYGRLYTWEAATKVCSYVGEGWRLAEQEDWRELAKQYGGVFNDSTSDGKGAFMALMEGGESQFNALLGGGKGKRADDFWRIEAHGFYWTNTSVNDTTAWYINFGKGRPALYLQNDGEKSDAFTVRCVKDK